MEAEERVTEVARKELSKWASLLPKDNSKPEIQTINPYAQKVSIREILLLKEDISDNSVIN